MFQYTLNDYTKYAIHDLACSSFLEFTEINYLCAMKVLNLNSQKSLVGNAQTIAYYTSK